VKNNTLIVVFILCILAFIMYAEKEETQLQEQIVCAQDVMDCPDGSFVARDPENNCEFPACPEPQEPEEKLVCAQDVKECDDGSFVARDPNNNCEFKDCPVPPAQEDDEKGGLPVIWIAGILILLILALIVYMAMRKHSENPPGHAEE
jgi:hypothetical protein